MDFLEYFEAFSPILVGFLSAYFGSLFALKKFKNEKIWDERRAGYTDVIHALEEILYWAEIVRAESFCEPSSDIPAKYDEALREISKYAITGELIFSNQFYVLLTNTNHRIRKITYEIDDATQGYRETPKEAQEAYLLLAMEIRGIVSESLPQLIKFAKEELPKFSN